MPMSVRHLILVLCAAWAAASAPARAQPVASEAVFEAYRTSAGNPRYLNRVIRLANQVPTYDPQYRAVMLVRASATAMLVSIYNLGNFSLTFGYGRGDVISYKSYFNALFSYSAAPSLRARWEGAPVVVAVAAPAGCNLFEMMSTKNNFVTHWMNGARDPIRPSVTFGVNLTLTEAITDRAVDTAIKACRTFGDPAFHYPRFVVVGQLQCRERACTSVPWFLVRATVFGYSTASMLPGVGDYLQDSAKILGELRRMGVR
jgi:hypothetical protein